MVARQSPELINLVALAMRTGVTATSLRDTIFNHPTSGEALGEVLHARSPRRHSAMRHPM
jgi:pyruvate/2-oxoglutarate dehydrogenase complex dihydrolipoamide dehydrogenase (E3) component